MGFNDCIYQEVKKIADEEEFTRKQVIDTMAYFTKKYKTGRGILNQSGYESEEENFKRL